MQVVCWERKPNRKRNSLIPKETTFNQGKAITRSRFNVIADSRAGDMGNNGQILELSDLDSMNLGRISGH